MLHSTGTKNHFMTYDLGTCRCYDLLVLFITHHPRMQRFGFLYTWNAFYPLAGVSSQHSAVRQVRYTLYGLLCRRLADALCDENTTINNRLIIINIISLYRLTDAFVDFRTDEKDFCRQQRCPIWSEWCRRKKNSRPYQPFLDGVCVENKIFISCWLLSVFLHSGSFYKVFPHVLQIDVPGQVKFDIILLAGNARLSIF